jgi:5-methylcytosine-specific restriction endonuclease McrA
MYAYVISKNNKKLMPTNPCNARLLLKNNKAKVVLRCPFTIQLLYDTGEYTQPVFVGIDDGSKIVGLASVGNGKVYFAANLNLRTDIHEKMSSRQEARRSRRNHLRYRKPRFLNRKRKSLPPSILARKDEIIRVISSLPLPIEEIIIEDVQVDIRKIVTPDIKGFGYQESNKIDENLRKAIVLRDNCSCQNKKCYQSQKIKGLEVHHIIHKEDGGPDTPENLITLCDKCHNDYHKNKISLEIPTPSSDFRSLKEAMHVMQGKTYLRTELAKIAHVSLTYGYITSENRKKNNLPKEHFIDAIVIAGSAFRNPKTDLQDIKLGTLSTKEIPKQFFSVSFLPRQQRKLFFSLPKKGKGRVPYEVNNFVATDRKRVIVGKNPKLFGKTDVPQGFTVFRKGDLVKVKGFIKEINSIYSNGALAFARIKGEPNSSSPKNIKLLRKRQTIKYNICLYDSIN